MEASIQRVNEKYRMLKKTKLIFLPELPKPTAVSRQGATTCSAIHESCCKAININGTPCKLRARLGSFCLKHAS